MGVALIKGKFNLKPFSCPYLKYNLDGNHKWQIIKSLMSIRRTNWRKWRKVITSWPLWSRMVICLYEFNEGLPQMAKLLCLNINVPTSSRMLNSEEFAMRPRPIQTTWVESYFISLHYSKSYYSDVFTAIFSKFAKDKLDLNFLWHFHNRIVTVTFALKLLKACFPGQLSGTLDQRKWPFNS